MTGCFQREDIFIKTAVTLAGLLTGTGTCVLARLLIALKRNEFIIFLGFIAQKKGIIARKNVLDVSFLRNCLFYT
jgi:hypothetical protein